MPGTVLSENMWCPKIFLLTAQIPDLGSRIPDPGSRIPYHGSRITDHGSWIPDFGSLISGSRIPGPLILNLGSRILDLGYRISNTGSNILDQQQQQKRRGNNFCSHKILKIILFLNRKWHFLAKTKRIIVLFTQWKMFHEAIKIMGLGSGIRKKPIPYPGSKVKKTPDPGFRVKQASDPGSGSTSLNMTDGEQGGVAGGARLSASQRHHGHEGDARRRILGRHPQAGDEPQAPRGRPGEAPALRPRLAAQALHRLTQHSHVRVRGILFFLLRAFFGCFC